MLFRVWSPQDVIASIHMQCRNLQCPSYLGDVKNFAWKQTFLDILFMQPSNWMQISPYILTNTSNFSPFNLAQIIAYFTHNWRLKIYTYTMVPESIMNNKLVSIICFKTLVCVQLYLVLKSKQQARFTWLLFEVCTM